MITQCYKEYLEFVHELRGDSFYEMVDKVWKIVKEGKVQEKETKTMRQILPEYK